MPAQATDSNARFNDFWHNRYRLDPAQWSAFYQLTYETLHGCRFPELAGLPDNKKTYIDNFFSDRIFDPARTPPTTDRKPVTLGYLVTMFRHYLNDLLRDPWSKRKVETDIPDEPESGNDPLAGSLTAEPIRQAAEDFLAGRPPWENLAKELWWIRPYLTRHFCADKSEALSTLARQLDIPSYHHKAQKLGITSAKGGFSDPTAFRATYLGRWIDQIGLDLSDDDAPAQVRIALQWLCHSALYGAMAAAL